MLSFEARSSPQPDCRAHLQADCRAHLQPDCHLVAPCSPHHLSIANDYHNFLQFTCPGTAKFTSKAPRSQIIA